MSTHSSILAWKIPWTEEPGGVPFMGLQRVIHLRVYARMHTGPMGQKITEFYGV